MSNAESLRYFAPEMVLIAGTVALFLADLFASHVRRRAALLGWLTLGVLGAAAVGVALLPGARGALFGGLVALDSFARFFYWLFLLAAALTVAIVAPSREVPAERIGEFYALLLAMTLGLFLMASSTDLLMIFLSVELVSLVSYILTVFRSGDRRANEGALKYVIYGGASSGVMLYGMSIFYGLFGTTRLLGPQGIGAQLSAVTSHLLQGALFGGAPAAALSLLVATIFVLAGIGYKIAVVPFHMWCPDAYEAAPTAFSAFLSIGPKAAGFALAIRFFFGAFVQRTVTGGVVLGSLPWPAILGALSVASMTLGNLAALGQTNMKRLLAYSSISHAGYILMGLAAVSVIGAESMLIYLVVYLFMGLGAFLVVQAVARSSGSESIYEYRGLSVRAPLAAITLAIFLFSLTGLPPLGGFIGKFYLFYAVIQAGGPWYWALAVAGVLNSAVSLYYYARVIRAMFLDQPFTPAPVVVGPLYGSLMVALAAPVLVLGVYWSPLFDWAQRSFRGLLG